VPYAAVASINGAAERFSPTRKREAHIPKRVQECSRPIARTVAHRAPWRCPECLRNFAQGSCVHTEALYRAACAVVSYQLCFLRAARSWGMDRPQKITFAEMRDMGVRGLLVYCADYRCSRYYSAAAKLVSYFLCSVRLMTSKITAVDRPNNSTPFIAVIGPIKRHRGTGRMSPYSSVVQLTKAKYNRSAPPPIDGHHPHRFHATDRSRRRQDKECIRM
jgi:hypothetical protein